ncbi:unnamed protein product [Bursaphelenchus okinawaensis]|uniref:Uncharacterized protein n=1 Tax=Bursaphelenchus okinawaensis TaxID=465554 RepID=A0A811JV21_9BILA|nr:unnamed protein product [Bursaphelenchus okinawaensis]CAG9084597.1 unnamed protein product [Bursaphelenchus okinawaensis]
MVYLPHTAGETAMPTRETLFDGESSSQRANSDDDDRHQEVEPSPTFVEKQLLALHISLKLEVDEEKRKVTQLLGILRQVRAQLPEAAVKTLDASQNSQLEETGNDDNVSRDDLTELERERDALQADVVKYRHLCGLLRARLEQYNLMLSSAQKEDSVPPNEAGESVVTRF